MTDPYSTSSDDRNLDPDRDEPRDIEAEQDEEDFAAHWRDVDADYAFERAREEGQ